MRDPTFDIDASRRADVAQQLAAPLLTEPAVVFAYLHGSFVRPQPFHDIDVGVYLDTPASDYTRRAVELSHRLSSSVGYPVDVRALNAAPLAFQFKAMQGELLMCRDEERLAALLELTGRRYLDIEPILRRATRDAFAP